MRSDGAGMPGFIQSAADDATYFRSIVLFGPNTASYKFALSCAAPRSRAPRPGTGHHAR
ncbi:hypothetical protein [Deinococcus sp.]|uniref:hypothetical protein n=1 Tax=Deinococcus sp. TaxID=47478 RepID=UPI0025BB1B2A|nr:hypothetical protein [Deinococcus sp.]